MWFAAATAILGGTGCGATWKEGFHRIERPEERYARDGRNIHADPIAFLRELDERCEALEQYCLVFYRQERLGLFQSLSPLEEIQATFRKEPFSVKFEWHDPAHDYYESVYVQGQNHNKLLVRERRGFLASPPMVRILDVSDPVKFLKARNPVTDFGLAGVAHRTLTSFSDPELGGLVTVEYQGLVDLEPTHRACHHLKIKRPTTSGYPYTRQYFYVDAETLLPAGTDLWLQNGDLGARYRYADVDSSVTLTDVDFRLSKDHPDLDSPDA